MNRSLWWSPLILLALAPVAFALRAAPTGDEHKNLDKLPDAPGNMVCPSGHRQIKLISGYRAYPTRCGILPAETEICAICISVYNRAQKKWERVGSRPNDFSIALSGVIRSLPIPDKKIQSREPAYQQYWKDGRIDREYIVCRSFEPYDDVVKRVKQYLKKNKVDISSASEDGQKMWLDTKWNKYDLHAEVSYVDIYKDVYVRIEISTPLEIWDDEINLVEAMEDNDNATVDEPKLLSVVGAVNQTPVYLGVIGLALTIPFFYLKLRNSRSTDSV